MFSKHNMVDIHATAVLSKRLNLVHLAEWVINSGIAPSKCYTYFLFPV